MLYYNEVGVVCVRSLGSRSVLKHALFEFDKTPLSVLYQHILVYCLFIVHFSCSEYLFNSNKLCVIFQ